MPIFEEKLICPLAIRYTQEHIREVFRDGLVVEDTIRQIKTQPGIGDYDIILDAPFPNIEIIRWYQRDELSSEFDADHWFTLDNRRLYCLQRVAASLWPQRVAAVVELLYSAPDSAKRKDDSTTAGRIVSIGHNARMLTGCWDWRSEAGAVRCSNGHELLTDGDRSPWGCDTCGQVMPSPERFRCLICDYDLCRECHASAPRLLTYRDDDDPLQIAAKCNMVMDDKKTSTAELIDAPAAPSLLMDASYCEPIKRPSPSHSASPARSRGESEQSTELGESPPISDESLASVSGHADSKGGGRRGRPTGAAGGKGTRRSKFPQDEQVRLKKTWAPKSSAQA